jgi:hypothetical protein
MRFVPRGISIPKYTYSMKYTNAISAHTTRSSVRIRSSKEISRALLWNWPTWLPVVVVLSCPKLVEGSSPRVAASAGDGSAVEGPASLLFISEQSA